MERAGVQVETGKSQGGRGTSSGLLQRQCACGTHTMGGGQCTECQKKKIGVGGRPLQTKLAISEPGDAYEQEADQVAEQVMRMSPVDVSKRQKIGMTQPLVQRRASGSTTGLAEAPPTVYDALNSPGQPLDKATRALFEPRFGQDFSQVRVHTGSTAEKSAGNLNAHAYTVGQDIVFANGQFSPGTYEGRRLIVHELTHVLQQRDGSAAERVQRRETKYSKGPSTEFLQVGWNDVYELGIVYKEGTQAQGGGVNLRNSPGGEMIRWLPQNTKVFILKHSVKHKAYAVSIVNPDGGTGEFGYVAATHIWRNLPDPDSNVFKIKAGQSPIMIATLHYWTKGFNVWAKDLRYVVNALVWVNQQAKHNAKGPSGISKEAISTEWYTAKSTADVYIWLPGVDFMNAIYETVAEHGGGTGSITGDLWQKVKKVGYWIAYGLAFVGGLVHGFVKSLWDAVVGLAEMIVDLIVSIFTAKVLSDAKELWEAVSKMTWQDIKDSVGAWADKWEKKLNSKDSWTAGHAHGYLTGYVMAEAAQLLVTAGTLTAAKGALWGSRLGKAIQRTRGFKALVTGLEELGGPASKTRKLVGETREALKATKVFTTLKVAREWAMRTLKLSAEFAKDLSLDAINRLGRLPEAMWKRLSRLSESAKRVLFGCASPCKCDTDTIEKIFNGLTNEEIEHAFAPLWAAAKATEQELATAAGKTEKVAKQGRGGKVGKKAAALPTIPVEEVVQEAIAVLRKQGIKGLHPTEYGTKLAVAVNDVLRKQLGVIPSGWIVGTEKRLGKVIKLAPENAKLTVKEYMTKYGLTDQYPQFSEKLLRTRIEDLKPDLFVRAPDGRALVWDVTSQQEVRHVAKTMFYSQVIGHELGGFIRISESYWK